MTRNHVTYKRFNWHKQTSTILELQPHHTMRPLSLDKLNIVISILHSSQTTCQISSSTGFSIGTISKIHSEHFSDLPKSSGGYCYNEHIFFIIIKRNRRKRKLNIYIYQGETECTTTHTYVSVNYINCILSIHQIRYTDTAHMAIHGHRSRRPIRDRRAHQ